MIVSQVGLLIYSAFRFAGAGPAFAARILARLYLTGASHRARLDW
jgi:hypothetical protein